MSARVFSYLKTFMQNVICSIYLKHLAKCFLVFIMQSDFFVLIFLFKKKEFPRIVIFFLYRLLYRRKQNKN